MRYRKVKSINSGHKVWKETDSAFLIEAVYLHLPPEMETGRERPTTAATMSTQLSIVDSGAFSPSSQQAQECSIEFFWSELAIMYRRLR